MKRKHECEESCDCCKNSDNPLSATRIVPTESSSQGDERHSLQGSDSPVKPNDKDANDSLKKLLCEKILKKQALMQAVPRYWKVLSEQRASQEMVVKECVPNTIFLSYLKSRHRVGILRLINENKYSVSNYNLFPPLSAGAPPLNNILGSCNGMVCLGNREGAGYRIDEEDLMLLDPRTKRFQLVKDCQINFGLLRGHYGLGYDHKTNDFKLVKVCTPMSFHQEKNLCPKQAFEMVNILIHSWKYGVWREIFNEDWAFTLLDRPGIFFEGKLYWPGKVYEMQGKIQGWSDCLQDALISFDLTTETFGSIELPADLQGEYCSFGVAGGRLVATVCRYGTQVWECIDNRFSLVQILETNKAHMRCLMEPLHQTRNVTVILQDGRKITIYNTSNRTNLYVVGHDKWIHEDFRRHGPRMEAVPLAESVFPPSYKTPEENCE